MESLRGAVAWNDEAGLSRGGACPTLRALVSLGMGTPVEDDWTAARESRAPDFRRQVTPVKGMRPAGGKRLGRNCRARQRSFPCCAALCAAMEAEPEALLAARLLEQAAAAGAVGLIFVARSDARAHRPHRVAAALAGPEAEAMLLPD